ncbi:MAG: LemA family protein [Rickettsiales bacterium]|jgi:LemA protein|nr:LemA family protein [Rickettsiales bacterium]
MWIAICIIAIIGLYILSVYNGLVARRVQAREAWATIDTQLKRRYDLIPNLVSAVKGAAKHEKETLESVIAARNSAMSAHDVAARGAAENVLTDALKSIFALSESYPTLQANANFMELQNELTDTETKIQAARQFYNSVVMSLNTNIEQFPASIVANMFKFVPEKFFELDEEEKKAAKKAPKVEF